VTLTESDKDRIAAIVHQVRNRYQAGDPEFWRGGHPERAMADAFAGLGPEETSFAIALLEQDIARLSERESDHVLDRVDALDGALEVRRQLDRGDIGEDEAKRRVREIDRASGGAISEEWDI
jgi:hypothetical protein